MFPMRFLRFYENDQSILSGLHCTKAIRRTRVKLRFVSPCLCGLFNKEDSEAGAHRAFNKRTPIGTQRFQLQRQSVHPKRAELRMVLR